MASELCWNNMFAFSLKSPSSAALLHFPGAIMLRMWPYLRMSWGSSCFLLCTSQVQSMFSFHNAFSHCLLLIHFLQYQQKRALAKEEFCSTSQKRSYLSVAWLHLRKVILWSSTLKTDNALSPEPPIQALSSKISTRVLLWYISNLTNPFSAVCSSRDLGQHNLLLLELILPPSSMPAEVNYSSATCCWQIHLKFGSFSHSWHQLCSGAFLGLHWRQFMAHSSGNMESMDVAEALCHRGDSHVPTSCRRRFCSAVSPIWIISPFTAGNTCCVRTSEVLPHQLAAPAQIYTSVTEVRIWPDGTQPVLLEELNGKRQYTEMAARCRSAARHWKNFLEP